MRVCVLVHVHNYLCMFKLFFRWFQSVIFSNTHTTYPSIHTSSNKVTSSFQSIIYIFSTFHYIPVITIIMPLHSPSHKRDLIWFRWLAHHYSITASVWELINNVVNTSLFYHCIHQHQCEIWSTRWLTHHYSINVFINISVRSKQHCG